MLAIKPRVWLLGMLAMLLVGSFAAASAEAQGPFWYHRAQGGQGKGVKLSGQQGGAPFEEVRGGGGEVILEGKLLGTEVVIASSQLQVKGIIYNNALQGQAKLEFVYVQPRLVKPEGTTCGVIVGSRNVVKVYGHQGWTWDGSLKQLKEQPQQNQKPDWIFLGQEIQQGAQELPKGVPFTTITLGGAGCLLSATRPVEGSAAARVMPANVGEYSTTQEANALENGALQHFWNGGSNIGVEVKLLFNNEPAKLKQAAKVSTFGVQGGTPQEVALYGD